MRRAEGEFRKAQEKMRRIKEQKAK
eukprot:SAG11_NODE_12907_length_679_cov_3.448276_2_plen_24_part_01